MQPFCGLPLTRVYVDPKVRHPHIEWVVEGLGIPVVFNERDAATSKFITVPSPVYGIRGIASFTPYYEIPCFPETIKVGEKYVLRRAPLDISLIALDGNTTAYSQHLENAIRLSLNAPIEHMEADGKWSLVTYVLDAVKKSVA